MMMLRVSRVLLPFLIVTWVLGLGRQLSGGESLGLAVGPLGVELGVVNLLLLTYIGALMWLLARYSATNLRGQRRLERFGSLFVAMTVSLMVLVAAADVLTLAVAWTVSGALLGPLVAHAGTPASRAAAQRVSRSMVLSSGLVWAAVAVAWFSGIALDGTDPQSALAGGPALLVAGLMVAAGVVRSALAPFHRWLPETAEAPSPVSALLHAGVVNAAGVVAVLQWDLLSAQPTLLLALAITGLATVVWCSLEQRVRPDVKGRLAASTSAQMGWMALQVGLGAPAAAMLHLMGHGGWKAWLFLRAGGAVSRARREPLAGPRVRTADPEHVVLALLPLALLLSAAIVWWEGRTISAAHLLLAGIAGLLAVAVGAEAAGLERSRSSTSRVVALTGGVAVATYLVVAVEWDQRIADIAGFAHPEVGGGFVLAGVAVAAVAGLAWAGARIHPGSHHPIATLASATSLPPKHRPGRRPIRRPVQRPVDERRASPPVALGRAGRPDETLVRETVAMAGRLVGPAWPLRATVAANPLAGLEVLPFDTAVALGERFHRTPMRPSFSWFLDLYETGRISDHALTRAMDRHGLGGGPRGVAGLLDLTEKLREQVDAEPDSRDSKAERPLGRGIAEAHVWSARAWHRAEDRGADLHGPFQLWQRSARHPVYRLVAGHPKADGFAVSLPEDPARAILDLLDRAGLAGADLFEVATALLSSGPGWVAHAQWRARRSGSPGPLLELVALRLALCVLHENRVLAADQADDATDGAVDGQIDGAGEEGTGFVVLQKIWLDALDATTREAVCRPLAERSAHDLLDVPGAATATPPESQSVWCIDVRSERIRRHLESTGNHETFGFAGFFGLLGRVVDADGRSFDQCPVIVAPAIEIELADEPLRVLPAMTRAATRVAARPGLAFGVAEASGAAAFSAALGATLSPRRWRRLLDLAVRGRMRPGDVVLKDLADSHRRVTVAERADAAEGMLRTIGLTKAFAPVVVLVGHGSTTENNAYATAYDCGACGGNPGLVNAAAMAQVLNDPAVRRELADRGIEIPPTTRALAALHDTTTDEVTIHQAATEERAAQQAEKSLVEASLIEAGRLAAAEREPALPDERRRSLLPQRLTPGARLAARATDWSEPMPEWGLAGCAAIIVGPRRLTRGLDLAGQTFLHSYDRQQDPDGSVLAAIMSAPVIVSQWIASQYWFSSVAPTSLGAGDKTTHNVLGDVGVLSGAHGDLRTGLPWQALFARDPGSRPDRSAGPSHVPSRHLVVLDADPHNVMCAIRESSTLTTLVVQGWMRVVVLDQGRVIDALDLVGIESTDPSTAP